MNVRQFVKALNLIEGQKHRGNCPSCQGHNTFSAEKDGGDVKYFCFKAGCDVGGTTKVGYNIDELRQYQTYSPYLDTKPTGRPMPKDYELERYNELNNYYYIDGIPYPIPGLKLYKKDARVMFPVTNTKFDLVGYTGKTLEGSTPKWIKYGECVGFFLPPLCKVQTAVIVEDPISAVRLDGTHHLGYALLGTNVSNDHIKQLKELGVKQAIIALDKDAVKKSIEAYRSLSAHFMCSTIFIDKDIKDMDIYEYETFLGKI